MEGEQLHPGWTASGQTPPPRSVVRFRRGLILELCVSLVFPSLIGGELTFGNIVGGSALFEDPVPFGLTSAVHFARCDA
jgi:hypothetical protein